MIGSLIICTPIPIVPGPAGNNRLAPVTMEWVRAREGLIRPMAWNLGEARADGFAVAEAREFVMTKCLEHGAEFLFFLDYDVLPPPETLSKLLYHARNRPEHAIYFAPYCAKTVPPLVLIWRDSGRGVHWDWTEGDLLTDCWGVGMGCTLIRMDSVRALQHDDEHPWFRTIHNYDVNPEGRTIRTEVTEDLYFCERMQKEAGTSVLIDTSIRCGHIDNATGTQYWLPADCLPVRRAEERRKAAEVTDGAA